MTRPDWPIGSGTDEKKKMTKSLMLRNHFISFSLKIQELGHNVSSDNHKDCNNNEHKANNQKIEPAITTTATTTTTTMKTRPNKSRSSWFANMTGNKERRSGAQDFAFDSADLDYYMRNYSKSKKRQTTTRSNDDQVYIIIIIKKETKTKQKANSSLGCSLSSLIFFFFLFFCSLALYLTHMRRVIRRCL